MSHPLLTLLSSMSLNEAAALHGLDVSVVGGKHVSVNYNQLTARDSDPVASACRGLVLCNRWAREIDLDSIQEFEILARPFKRFFNLGQGSAAFQTLEEGDEIQVKHDGTCIIVYFDHIVTGKWQCATRNNPLANQQISGGFGMTFRGLFEKALGRPLDEFFAGRVTEYTYVYELVGPYNQLVVQYDETQAFSLAMVDRETGDEFSIYDGPILAATDFKGVLEYVSSLPPHLSEGVVVTRIDRVSRRVLGRVKVKSAAYVLASKQSDSLVRSDRNIMEVILDGRWDDVRGIVPLHVRERGDELSENLRVHFRVAQTLVDATLCMATLHFPGSLGSPEHRKAVAQMISKESPQMLPMVMTAYSQLVNGNSAPFNVLEFYNSQKKQGIWGKGTLDNLIETCDKEAVGKVHVRRTIEE
jgi:hypothetical protein